MPNMLFRTAIASTLVEIDDNGSNVHESILSRLSRERETEVLKGGYIASEALFSEFLNEYISTSSVFDFTSFYFWLIFREKSTCWTD